MKKIDTYIFKQFIGPFLGGIMGFLIIIAIDPLYFTMNYILIKKIPAAIVMKWFFYRLISDDMNYAFPMACLFSGIIVFGRLSNDSEIVAIKAGGISFRRILAPVIAFSCVALIISFLFAEFIAPVSNTVNKSIKKSQIFKFERSKIKNKVFIADSENRIICAQKVDPQNKRLEKVMVYELENAQIKRRISALYGYLVDKKLSLFSCIVDVDNVQKLMNEIHIDVNKGFGNYTKQHKNPKDMSIREIIEEIKNRRLAGSSNTRELFLEMYSKLSIPFACVIFTVIGSCMGTTSKRGGSAIGFGISIFIIFIYYVIMSISKSLGNSGILHPLIAAWTQNIVFFFYCWHLINKVKK